MFRLIFQRQLMTMSFFSLFLALTVNKVYRKLGDYELVACELRCLSGWPKCSTLTSGGGLRDLALWGERSGLSIISSLCSSISWGLRTSRYCPPPHAPPPPLLHDLLIRLNSSRNRDDDHAASPSASSTFITNTWLSVVWSDVWGGGIQTRYKLLYLVTRHLPVVQDFERLDW